MPEPLIFVDVAFRLTGESLPLEHGYALYGAISRVFPKIHDANVWGVHPVAGRYGGPGRLLLQPHSPRSEFLSSRLRIRLPVQDIPQVLSLAGKQLDVDGHRVTIGVPEVWSLSGDPHLKSRFVTIKGYEDEEGFGVGLRAQLESLLEGGDFELEVGQRRVMRVKDKQVVGFAVEVMGLDPQRSLLIQSQGVGGRRKMGAGLFVPVPKERE